VQRRQARPPSWRQNRPRKRSAEGIVIYNIYKV
jgi:hypothetical protein